jgi:REP element-mobilizing transposase RayT
MRQLRILGQGVWYEIRSRINNREALFRHANALALFARVFRETMLRFVFEVRGLRLEDDWLTFYIKPEDGFELPEIMKWMKQVFAQRYNAMTGRIGHIWGDRYWSRILKGEPGDCASGSLPLAQSPRSFAAGLRCLKAGCALGAAKLHALCPKGGSMEAGVNPGDRPHGRRTASGDRPRYEERAGDAGFSPVFPPSAAFPPG